MSAAEEPVLVWKDPPPTLGGRLERGAWRRVFDALRADPGQWALVRSGGDHASVAVHAARRTHGATDIEVTQRKREDGLYDVYARAKP